MTVILLGIGVYALFSYVGEALEGFGVRRSWYLVARIIVSFLAVWYVLSWHQWYFGFAVLGVSRLCSRIDNYITSVARSISQQRRRQ